MKWYGSMLDVTAQRDQHPSPTSVVFFVRAQQRLLSGLLRSVPTTISDFDREETAARLCAETSGVRVDENASTFFLPD